MYTTVLFLYVQLVKDGVAAQFELGFAHGTQAQVYNSKTICRTGVALLSAQYNHTDSNNASCMVIVYNCKPVVV